MKNSIKLITWLVGGLFTFSSCTDIDVDLKSTYTEYPDAEIAKESKMAGLYYGFGGALGLSLIHISIYESEVHPHINLYLTGKLHCHIMHGERLYLSLIHI